MLNTERESKPETRSPANLTTTKGSYAPRTGLGQALLNWALASPLWKYVLVPQARQTMVKTAEANGIEWRQAKRWIHRKLHTREKIKGIGEAPKGDLPNLLQQSALTFPDYYQQASFHAYEAGNLCWEAAMEQEIASRAVGARNFPRFGSDGDVVFRKAFLAGLEQAGARLPTMSAPIVAVDIGCGTGLSSRQLATTPFLVENDKRKGSSSKDQRGYIDKVLGIDLSPYYIHVGKTLLELAPLPAMTDSTTVTSKMSHSHEDNDAWVNPIDERAKNSIDLHVANAQDLSDVIPESNSVDIVQILFVLHELPADVAVSVIREAHRILRPGGQLWMGEMDFEAPAYAAQRANPLLFSLLRATEPYLDDYADHFATDIRHNLESGLFSRVVWTAATGRHYTVVATKHSDNQDDNGQCQVEDLRFLPNGDYAVEDTHLQLWESKQ